MKKDVFKIETGSRGEIEFVGEVQIDVKLSDWCRKYFDDEVLYVLDDEFESEEEKEGFENYVEEFFDIVEVVKDEVYSMGLGEERMEYYIDMDSEMFKSKVKEWEELGWRGEWMDLSGDMIWDFIVELDELSW